jgi:N-acetylhexosamine 1-kinase
LLIIDLRLFVLDGHQIEDIVSLFDLCGPVEISDFNTKGNINQESYLVIAGPPSDRSEHILQRLNPDVFIQPRRVMNAMILCIDAQQKALSAGILRKDQEWETIRLIPTKEGNAFLELPNGKPECWRMMKRIPHVHSYRSLAEIPDIKARLQVAEEAGRGLALFRTLTAGMDVSRVIDSLPGYHDITVYYDQLFSVLAGCRTLQEASDYLPEDPVTRKSTERHFFIHIQPEKYRQRMRDPELAPFVALALEQRSFALTISRQLAAGELQKAVIHGDTKLDNFLFSKRSGKVKTIIDMDTIMPHTWLTDWGDMVRSLANVAGERETDPQKIEIDLEVFRAAARGFVKSSRHIAPREVELMTDAAQIMALELGVRFLADYLRGDSYFKLKPEDPHDLNKTRSMVQFRVFELLRKNSRSAKLYIKELSRQSSADR